MSETFERWLLSQEERQDSVGKLARAVAVLDLVYMPSQRKPDEHKKWADIITRHGEVEHVFAFNRAWQEYQSLLEEASQD